MALKYLVSGAAALTLFAGQAMAEGKLSIYHWFEYIPDELLAKFEAETGARG